VFYVHCHLKSFEDNKASNSCLWVLLSCQQQSVLMTQSFYLLVIKYEQLSTVLGNSNVPVQMKVIVQSQSSTVSSMLFTSSILQHLAIYETGCHLFWIPFYIVSSHYASLTQALRTHLLFNSSPATLSSPCGAML
jgi:hypothetical protein